jgi:hypothetical protein
MGPLAIFAVARRLLMRLTPRSSSRYRHAAAAMALACVGAASAADEGGLYIAGAGFSFQQAGERAIAQNPGGTRFFVLTLPAEAAALGPRATPAQQRLRDRVLAANGVLLVCQRDLDNRRINASNLAAGVVPVRGASNDLPAGERYFAGENPANLPAANEALRRLRSTCA